jgi:hypothetical protein
VSSTPVCSELRRRCSALSSHRHTINASTPLPSLADQAPTCASSSSLVRSRGLNQLADRLAEKV